VHIPHFLSSTENNALNSAPPINASLDTPFFLFVGRLEKLKGVQTLIPVFRRYRKANLLIVGSGSYETHLRKLARGCPNIQFVGSRYGRQLQDLYRQAQAVVVPTLTFESFGQVIIEAFRQKTPAIVRDLGAMPEIIAESGGGFVYNSDDELVDALDRILTSPLNRGKMGTSGFQAYREKWTAEAHLKKYFEVIDAEVSAKESRKI
jgi:glycosyltransferase involved in cell wall biosynthesis